MWFKQCRGEHVTVVLGNSHEKLVNFSNVVYYGGLGASYVTVREMHLCLFWSQIQISKLVITNKKCPNRLSKLPFNTFQLHIIKYYCEKLFCIVLILISLVVTYISW